MSFLKKITRAKNIIINNFWLKVLSFIIAVILWLLVSGVIRTLIKGDMVKV